ARERGRAVRRARRAGPLCPVLSGRAGRRLGKAQVPAPGCGRRGRRMKGSWRLLATRAFVVWCFCFYVVVTLSSLDRRLQGDDHAIVWTSTSMRFGELPNR